MPGSDLPEKLRLFIFQYINSVGLIEVLLYLRDQGTEWKTSAQISRELRSNEASARNRLENLQSIGLIEENADQAGSYRFCPKSKELNEVVDLLVEEYRIRRHKVLELIFSSVKQAKSFADAFVIGKNPGKKGEENG